MYRVLDKYWSCLWTASADSIKAEFADAVGRFDEWQVQDCETGKTVPLMSFLATV